MHTQPGRKTAIFGGVWYMKKFLAIIALMLLLLAVAGCKEDLAAKKTTATSGPSAEEDAEAATAEADAEEESSGISDDFSEFITKRSSLEYTVSYEITSSSQGSSANQKMTQYFGGTDRLRMDSSTGGMESRTYLMDGTFYTCSNQGGKWMCISMPTQGENPTQQFDDIAENPQDYKITPDGTKSVAGTTAKCYKITTPQGNMKECFSKEGVPLYMETTFQGGSMKMQATSYKPGVKDSDFKLPAEPQDMNAMIAQYGGGQLPEGYGQ
jgi:outer membrane lipoprotein-sorting protein